GRRDAEQPARGSPTVGPVARAKETVVKHGAEQVLTWRRSFDIPPPPIDADSEFNPAKEAKYKDLDKADIPVTECLKDTITRVMPYWESEIQPQLKAGSPPLLL
ncbi:unnamed protein product, partial [Prorocentrum cordatum]